MHSDKGLCCNKLLNLPFFGKNKLCPRPSYLRAFWNWKSAYICKGLKDILQLRTHPHRAAAWACCSVCHHRLLQAYPLRKQIYCQQFTTEWAAVLVTLLRACSSSIAVLIGIRFWMAIAGCKMKTAFRPFPRANCWSHLVALNRTIPVLNKAPNICHSLVIQRVMWAGRCTQRLLWTVAENTATALQIQLPEYIVSGPHPWYCPRGNVDNLCVW